MGGLSDTAKLAMAEYPYQRMHKMPVLPPRQLDLSTRFTTMNHTAYLPTGGKPTPAVPSFTLGRKNDLGTSSTFHKVSLDEMQVSKFQVGSDAPNYSTSSHSIHQVPAKVLPVPIAIPFSTNPARCTCAAVSWHNGATAYHTSSVIWPELALRYICRSGHRVVGLHLACPSLKSTVDSVGMPVCTMASSCEHAQTALCKHAVSCTLAFWQRFHHEC